jgi:ABC-type multidrug transport system fused ATPase/permease subunit
VGAVFLIIYYVALLQAPLEKLRTEIEALQQATASIDRINALLAETPEVATGPMIDRANHVNGTGRVAGTTAGVEVTFANVSFHYADNDSAAGMPAGGSNSTVNGRTATAPPPAVLQEISFDLPAGQVLGLLGRTGSGKTTLTRLLLRLYQPQQGTILLNDLPLTGLDLATVRRTIGMVTQEVQLFQATLRDNLTFFDSTIKDQQITAVLEELGLGRWFAAQPQGLDTMLTGGGSGLSAGEAQLLAFVRVFLKDPQLVILDEASSRLDPATEQLLERAIDRLLANRTGIIIAHRLATVQRADRILLLDGGRVAEFGDRITLAADPNSHFAQLLRHGLPEHDLQEVLA